jgi:PAS domain S-box-containing protein
MMSRVAKRWTLLVALCVAGGALPVGAATGPAFHHFTTRDGLSDTRIRALHQDRRGFLWIGTADGLNRYDGYGFRVFRHDPADPHSLGPGLVTAIAEDGEGRLWLGLLEGGVSRFDPRTETFTHFRHDPTIAHSLSVDDVTALALDRAGRVWVGTGEGGLNRLDPASGQVTRFRYDPNDDRSLPSDEVTAIASDRSGVLWVGTAGGGLARLAGDVEPARFQTFRHDPKDRRSLSSNDVRAIREDRDGHLWIGTWDAGLNRLDPARTRVTRHSDGDGGRTGAARERIYDLLQDQSGALWIATWGGGLRRLDPVTGRSERFLADPGDPTSLSHANVASLLEDRSGLLWIGTEGGGLNQIDLRAKPFVRYAVTGDRGGGLSGRDVRSVIRAADGSVWAGTAGHGLNRIDRANNRITRFVHEAADPHSLADNDVWALLQDRRGTVWAGTFGGLDRFDASSGRFVHYRHRRNDPHSLSHDVVYSVFEDSADRLWVGTWDGLNLLDRATGRVVWHRVPGVNPTTVRFIVEGHAGALWLGVERRLVRFDPATGVFDVVADPARPDDSGAGRLWGMRFDSGGRGWVAASRGLAELSFSETASPPVLRRLGADDGMPRAFAMSVEVAADGQLWLGTTTGLLRYDPTRERPARLYQAADGLPDGFNPDAAFRARDGELFFGATGGLTSFRPAEIDDEQAPRPPVVLTALGLSHQTVSIGSGSPLQQSVGHTTAIELAHDSPVLTLEFAALSFRAPQLNRYRYRLAGFDDAWREVKDGTHTATYTNLAPRRYVFHVQGSNSDGVWNEQGATLSIHIRPPWWATWWFRALAIVSVAALLLAVHRHRTRAVEARSERLEREVREREMAQLALMRSERQLRLIADALPVMIAYVDAEGRIGFSNLASEKWFSRPRSELEGRLVKEVLPAEVYAQVEEHIDMAQGGERVDFDIALAGPGQPRRRISSTLVPHAEGHGRVLGFYAFAQDITERVRIQEELHRQHEQLAHASRVSTLGELATALAHELNQPLTAVLSNAHATLRLHAARPGLPVSEDVEETLRDIAQDAARAGEIIRRLRDLIRKGTSKKGPLDLNQAIRGVETLVRAAALENDVAMALDLAPNLPPCDGDAIQIQQVILNLVHNGVEAMRSMAKAERRMVMRTLRDKDAVAVSVEDSGPPLAQEVFDRLFMPFYTTKENGLGMGLSISRSIIQAHGGTIEAHRGKARGLIVRFTLPTVTRRLEAMGPRMSA